jgi:hypothetical protein
MMAYNHFLPDGEERTLTEVRFAPTYAGKFRLRRPARYDLLDRSAQK